MKKNSLTSLRLSNVSESILESSFLEDPSGSYLNAFQLFATRFDSVPNFIRTNAIDCKKATQWFTENYHSEISDFCYDKQYLVYANKIETNAIFYFLYEDLMVNFDVKESRVRFLFKLTEVSKIDAIINSIANFKLREKKQHVKPEISLLVNGQRGIETMSFEIVKPKLSIDDNYNDDFKDIHKIILKRLSQKNDKGLVLLHGKPGTGKTSYIRYLISSVKKNVFFLPPNLAGAITSPSLISVLIENPNSIFVIEDAENIIVSREQDQNSLVSALLNISDGLLSDCLNTQIVCSFNTDISKIDSALMRKGRLIAKYEFKELEIEKAKRLSKKLGFDTLIEEPMTLTSIYNQEEMDFKDERKENRIGFQIAKENQFAEV